MDTCTYSLRFTRPRTSAISAFETSYASNTIFKFASKKKFIMCGRTTDKIFVCFCRTCMTCFGAILHCHMYNFARFHQRWHFNASCKNLIHCADIAKTCKLKGGSDNMIFEDTCNYFHLFLNRLYWFVHCGFVWAVFFFW